METDHLLLRENLMRSPTFEEGEANLKYLEGKAVEQAVSAAASASSAGVAKTVAESARDAANDSRVNAAQSKSDAAVSAAQAIAARQAAEAARDAQIAALSSIAVDTVADLRSRRGGVIRSARTLGRDAVADGGLGNFRWDDLSVDPDDGVITVSAGGTGRWKLDHGGVLRAKQAGCVTTGAADTAAKILQWMLWCAQNNVAFAVDALYELRDPILLTDAYSGLRVLKVGSAAGITWAAGLTFNPADQKGLLMLKSTTELRDVYIAPLIYDGNKANISGIDNTVHGISIIDNAGLYTRVVIDEPECRNNRGSGISARSGGVEVRNPRCHDNSWHGVGVDASVSSTGETHFVEPDCRNNGAYGFDASGGRTVVTGELRAFGNGQGGAKTSTDCKKFKVGRLFAKDNKAFGFRTTGTAADMVLDIDDLEVAGTISDGGVNPGQSVSVSTGKLVRIGRITADGAAGGGDSNVRLGGATQFDVGPIASFNAPNHGVYLPGFNGHVGSILSDGAGKNGLLLDTTSNCTVRGDVTLRSSNKLLNTGNNQYAAVNIGSALNIAGSLVLDDTQGSPTQLKGLNSFNAGKNVIGNVKASQMAATDVFTTSNAGTVVKVLGNASGVVMETFETILMSGNGSTTAFTLNLTNALTSIGGGVYEATVYGNSNDANQYGFSVYQVSPTLVRVRFTTAPVTGTNNLTFLVHVKVYISR